jgi:hypothetical protein
MATVAHSITDRGTTGVVRVLSVGLAAIVIGDAIQVGAGFLGMVALPFIATAVLLRRGSLPASVAVILWNALFVFLGVNFAVANGFDAPGGDLLFAYVGSPMALANVVLMIRHRVQFAASRR